MRAGARPGRAVERIDGVQYVAKMAAQARAEGPVSPRLADLYFQCAQVDGEMTLEEWEQLVVDAMTNEVPIADVLEFRD